MKVKRHRRGQAVEFVGYAPGLDFEAKEYCIALVGRWMNTSEFNDCLAVPGFFPTGMIVRKGGVRYMVERGELVVDVSHVHE